ncbi:hypothetical protein B0J15DRAFT_410849, partial [Fusarium solani]
FLEQTFPAFDAGPTRAGVETASRLDDKALEKVATNKADLVEAKLNICNTLIKTVLDQTARAAINIFLFSVFISALKAAMMPTAGLEMPG